jgi:hypothetical protein
MLLTAPARWSELILRVQIYIINCCLACLLALYTCGNAVTFELLVIDCVSLLLTDHDEFRPVCIAPAARVMADVHDHTPSVLNYHVF